MAENEVQTASAPGEACRNCGAPLSARYCGACGQRALDPDERRLGHLLRDAFGALTNLDGRAWRTFIALLFRPGQLSRDYIAGRRIFWLSPIAVFLLANLLFFLSPPISDFTLQFEDQVTGEVILRANEGQTVSPQLEALLRGWRGPVYSPLASELVKGRVEARDAAARAENPSTGSYSVSSYRDAYNAVSSETGKLLIGLHIPFMALALAALFPARRLLFADHFVVALHMFSFFIIAQQLLMLPLRIASELTDASWVSAGFSYVVLTGLLVFAAYMVFAIRAIYAAAWWRVALSSVALIAALLAIHLFIYRPVQFLVIHALI